MAEQHVPIENAVAVRRRPGDTVTFINASAVDVYLDRDPNRLNATVAGAVPRGTLLAANGGSYQWPGFPGVIWFRAATATKIEVQP